MYKSELIKTVPPPNSHDIIKTPFFCTPVRHVYTNSGFIGLLCPSQGYITYMSFCTTTNIL